MPTIAWYPAVTIGSLMMIPVVILLGAILPLYTRWLGRHVIFGMILSLLLATVFGLIGRDLGLRNLFWHEDQVVQLVAGVSLMIVIELQFFLSFLLDDDPAGSASRCRRIARMPSRIVGWLRRRPLPDPGASETETRRLLLYLRIMSLPILAIFATPVLVAALSGARHPHADKEIHLIMLPLGAILTFLAIDLVLHLVRISRWRWWHGWLAAIIPMVVLVALALGRSRTEWLITAAMSISLLLAAISLATFATHDRLLLRLVLLAVLIVVQAWTNSCAYKLTYPGLDAYRDPDLAKLRTRQSANSAIQVGSDAESEFKLGQVADNVFLKTGDVRKREDALNHYQEAVCFDQNYFPALANIGTTKYYVYYNHSPGDQVGRIRALDESYKTYDQAIQAGDPSAMTRFGRGLTFQRPVETDLKLPDEEYIRANIDFSAAINADPWLVIAQAQHADILTNKLEGRKADGDIEYKLAAKQMERLAAAKILDLQLDKINPQTVGFGFYKEGLDRSLVGQRELAEAAFEKALRAGPGWGHAPYLDAPSRLLNDPEVLNRWLLARTGDWDTSKGIYRPKLVVVAVSGGGIVAAGWTTRCLTAIEEQFPEFPRHIRLITGASGGMVGAGHYVANLDGPEQRRSPSELCRLRKQIDEESLTPVVRQLVFRDLPSTLNPSNVTDDRGRVLEHTWESNTNQGLAKTFLELRKGEAAGWRPSLIVSPLLVEDGVQMVISNLDLEGFPNVNMHFFATFPKSRNTLKLSTALRMNAAFPFVTPAVSLPTVPPRRVADAGYVDNYGVRLAAAWIKRNRGWLAAHTSGVALVQIRAYPLGLPNNSETAPAPANARWLGAVTSGMQWLTTPLEGYTTAKKAAMVNLNDNLVDELQETFGSFADGEKFFKTFTLSCSEDVPLGWSITRTDRERLDHALGRADVQAECRKLVEFLSGQPAAHNFVYQSCPQD